MKQFEGDIHTYNKHLSSQESFILSMYFNYILILYKVSIIWYNLNVYRKSKKLC